MGDQKRGERQQDSLNVNPNYEASIWMMQSPPSSDPAVFEVDEQASREARAIMAHVQRNGVPDYTPDGKTWYEHFDDLADTADAAPIQWIEHDGPHHGEYAGAGKDALTEEDWKSMPKFGNTSGEPIVIFELWQKPTEQYPQGVHAISTGGQKWEMVGTCEHITEDDLRVSFKPDPREERERLRDDVVAAALAHHAVTVPDFDRISVTQKALADACEALVAWETAQ
jgi:hypothetical protein